MSGDYLSHNDLSSISPVNWLGMRTLYKREVWRFLKVFNQTILAPVVTTLLFLAIFTLALGGNTRIINEIPLYLYIAPGLIMMAVVQNAFANTSSSLMLTKIQGVIVDLLMPPISPAEFTFCMVMGGVSRGILVGIAVTLAIEFFVPLNFYSWGWVIYYTVAACTMMSLLGLLTGIWAQSFDQLAAITNYIVTPLAFLSGTFYSVRQLPEFWYMVSQYNPFFYMIDGFRYALIGHTDASVITGAIVLAAMNVVLWIATQWIVTRGYRMKT